MSFVECRLQMFEKVCVAKSIFKVIECRKWKIF